MASVTATEKLCKQPGETRYYSMDFSNLMATGETMTLSAITGYRQDGGTFDITFSGTVPNAQLMETWISGGTDKKKYRIEITADTSAGQILVGDGILLVEDE